MVPASVPAVTLLVCITLSGSTWSLPTGAWPPMHPGVHHQPLAPSAPLHPTLQELDPIDKCIFTCDYCYKQTKVLMACANECIMNAGETSMARSWIDTCPFFEKPIYFDYQPV